MTPARELRPPQLIARVLLALLPGALVMLWIEGPGLLLHALCACAGARAGDLLAQRLQARPSATAAGSLYGLRPLGDGSSLLSGCLLALAIPAHSPLGLALLAGLLASLLGKAAFGGGGRNLFNPAMLGYALILLGWPELLLQWPAADRPWNALASLQQLLGIGPGLPDGWSQATVLDSLQHNDRLTSDELFASNSAFGRFAGRGYEWAALAFAGGGLWLLQRRLIGWQAPVGMLAALLLASLSGWNGGGSDSHGSPLFHLFAGASLLGAFFIVSDPVSSPRTARARLCFGAGVGLLCYLIRCYGPFPDGLAFAVLLMNLLSRPLDHWCSRR